jgi:NAD(P)-dependent dehydrogenase (short-subunit alcohol dehydrogenase family)
MTQELAGRIALVTGASSGLGRAFALRFAKEGARVAVAARRVELLTELVEKIAAQGGEALPLVMDVTSAASIVDGYTLLSERWGSADIVIVNAGISSQALAIDLVVEDLDRILDINVRGAFLTAREGAKAMIAGDLEDMVTLLSSGRSSAITGSVFTLGDGQSL